MQIQAIGQARGDEIGNEIGRHIGAVVRELPFQPRSHFAQGFIGQIGEQILQGLQDLDGALLTMRLAAPGVASGVALVFLAITNELTATLLLAPNGTQTLATAFWAHTSEIDYAGAAPYALLMVLLSVPLTWLLYIQSKRSAGR